MKAANGKPLDYYEASLERLAKASSTCRNGGPAVAEEKTGAEVLLQTNRSRQKRVVGHSDFTHSDFTLKEAFTLSFHSGFWFNRVFFL